MAKSDLVVIWGTNAVATQVNVMTHAIRARKERGAKIVVVDIYQNATMKQADLALLIRPGTDGALACAVMHVPVPRRPRRPRLSRPLHRRAGRAGGASAQPRRRNGRRRITGLRVAEIEAFAAARRRRRKRTFFRLGYGFTRPRNGAVNMHAASCIAAVTGAWQHEGGGAFHNNGAIYHWNKTMIEGLDVRDPTIRLLDQSRIGADPDRRARRRCSAGRR